jgi:hypothetical protein
MASTLVTERRVVGNPARKNGILGLSWNPGRKKGHNNMATTKAKSKKKKPGASHRAAGSAAKKPNAGLSLMKYKQMPVKKRRNSAMRSGGGIAGTLVSAVVVIASAVASKVGAQMVLQGKNTGLMGYAGNLAAGAALYFAAKAAKAPDHVLSSIAGGTAVQIVLRGINDYTPLGEYVKDLGMGDYQIQSFVTPQILKSPNDSAEMSVPQGWGRGEVVMLPPPAPAAGMGSIYGGSVYSGASSVY